ncbi:MAG: aspartate dehydrogenase [Candidatus Woesearchaeota archaeon]
MKISIIGCGAIGSAVAKAIVDEISNDDNNVQLVGVSDVDNEKANQLISELGIDIKNKSIDELIGVSDLIIEAASKHIIKEVAEKTFTAGKDLMIMSIGGLIGNESLLNKAKEKGCNLYLPSGAIAGLDAVKAAVATTGSASSIKFITLTTTKPPKGLEGAPYIIEHNIDLSTIENAKEKKTIFEGSVDEAVSGFPKNINVSAALSLAGIGAEKTRVKIVVDPQSDKNMHEICVEGDFGKITTITENKPSPMNSKTSYLAVLSAIAMIKRIVSKVKVGS